ncbi:MAG: hypothetical protein AAB738_01225 [Patescibacteria group bacterium]
MTQFYFPIKKEETIRLGYDWMEPEVREYRITKNASELPSSIEETDDGILKEVIGCEHEQKCEHNCTSAFKLVPQELQFYRKMKIPIPRICPGCRTEERCALRNLVKLWTRKCMCLSSEASAKEGDFKKYQNTVKHSHYLEGQCPNEFETTYAPDRPEIVYCEQCYNAEVV